MLHRIRFVILITLLLGVDTQAALDLPAIDIPYQLFRLDNGLTLIVHEDHKAPIVAVNIWYHIGSKDEQRGKTGFAHLFEHLMFNGSEHYNDDYFQALERVGATRLNGTTNWDRTNYFENVPTSALDLALWMESDRMGHLLGAIDQAKLDEQRGVVQNEKRQRDNRPYGKAGDIQYRNIYPPNHPYSWLPIGSMADLDAATLEDVHGWFKQHYGAANTVVSIAGDISAELARQKVQQYFGDIKAGPPHTRQSSWVAKLTGTHRQISYDRVPQTMMLKSWNIPGYGSVEANYLDLVGKILSSGKTSRLYQRLVYEEQIATSINAYTSLGEIAGTFEITAMVKPGISEQRVDAVIEDELEKFLRKGPTAKELSRAKIKTFADFVRGVEQIGGFGGKSDILASNYVYTGNPAHYKIELARTENASKKDLLTVANNWLSDGLYHLEIRPFEEYSTEVSSVDRSKLPQTGSPPQVVLDDFKRSTLANGLTVMVAERHAIPVIRLRLLLDAGFASDQNSLAGVASLAMNMLDEGTSTRDALQISEQLAFLGAELSTGSNLDVSNVSLSSLTTTLDDSLELFADVALQPSFPETEMNRLKEEQFTRIRQEQTNPRSISRRVFPRLIYGDGHAYSNPLTGSGTLDSVRQITLEQLKAFHASWFKPNHATLIVVGDTTLDEIMPKLEKVFAAWQPGDIPGKKIATIKHHDRSRLYLVDRPASPQSYIFSGHITTPKANPDEIATELMNHIVGGSFTSRINMNLREDKHWSYSARSGFMDARGQRTFFVATGVQTDKTSEAMLEILKELNGIVGAVPITAEELDKVQKNRTLSLAGRWETAGSVLATLSQIVEYDLGDDYFQTYANIINSLTIAEVSRIATKLIKPDRLVWIVVGDRSKVEDGLNKLGFGEVILIDADGNLL